MAFLFLLVFLFLFLVLLLLLFFFFWGEGGGGLMSQDKIFSGVEVTSPKKSWIFEYADSI